MNKFEKLIEYIINDEDQKARELFHDIVVEKSRDIYESIMDEESMEETVAGPQVEDMVDEITGEEAMGEAEDDEQEFSLDADGEDDGEVAGDFPADSGEEAEHEEIEDKVMNIDAKLDELLAKFDEIMGDDSEGEEPAEEPAMDGGDMGDMDAEEEPAMFEGENPFAKGSGKSGSAQSGKSGSAMSGKSGKSGSGKTEGKQSTAELMREYVDKIQDMNLTGASEGDAVGATGKKTSVNDKSVTGPGADFGGTTATPKGGEQNQDGTSAPSSPKPQEIKSGNRNVPGGKADKLETAGKASGSEGKLAGADGSRPVNTKSIVAK
jgi:hypothetical protein